MPRDPEEKARFRGNDALYKENWDHIFNKKEKKDEEAQVDRSETGSDGSRDVQRDDGGHSH